MYLRAVNTTLNSTFTTNGTVNATDVVDYACHLSPHGRALSTVLTAFVGAIITGVSCGINTVFWTGWICWFPSLRIVLVGIYAILQVLFTGAYHGGSGDSSEADNDEVTVLGFPGWLFATCYAPVIQVMWLIGNRDRPAGALKVVRALGIAVTALPLTFDTKARYGEAFGKKYGAWFGVLFSLMTASSCLLLGVISSALLIKAVFELHLHWSIIFAYYLLTVIWAAVSLAVMRPTDAAESNDTILKVIGGIFFGAFIGIFVATIPAYILLKLSSNSPGVGLNTYLHCERVALWEKVIAVLP